MVHRGIIALLNSIQKIIQAKLNVPRAIMGSVRRLTVDQITYAKEGGDVWNDSEYDQARENIFRENGVQPPLSEENQK